MIYLVALDSVLIVLTAFYLLFRDTLNKLQILGFLYWITRDNGRKGDRLLSIGFMRETSFPWRRGKGLQVRCFKYVFQVGFCKKHEELGHDDRGLLDALDGRYLDYEAETLRKWK